MLLADVIVFILVFKLRVISVTQTDMILYRSIPFFILSISATERLLAFCQEPASAQYKAP